MAFFGLFGEKEEEMKFPLSTAEDDSRFCFDCGEEIDFERDSRYCLDCEENGVEDTPQKKGWFW